MRISLHPISDRRYDSYLQSRLTQNDTLGVPNLVVDGNHLTPVDKVLVKRELAFRDSFAAKAGAVIATGVVALLINKMPMDNNMAVADASPAQAPLIAETTTTEAALESAVTEQNAEQNNANDPSVVEHVQSRTFTYTLQSDSGQTEPSQANIEDLSAGLALIQSEGYSIYNVAIESEASDEWGDVETSFGVQNPENVFAANLRANGVSEALQEIAASKGIDLGDVSKSGIEVLLTQQQQDMFTALAENYGYTPQELKDTYRDNPDSLPEVAKSFLDATLGDSRETTINISTTKMISIPQNIQAPPTEPQAVEAQQSTPSTTIAPEVASASAQTTVQTPTQTPNKPSSKNPLWYMLAPLTGLTIAGKVKKRERIITEAEPEKINLAVTDEEAISIVKNKPSIRSRFKRSNIPTSTYRNKLYNWSDTLKYKHILRSKSVNNLFRLSFTDQNGYQKNIRVAFISHKPRYAEVSAIANALKKAVLVTEGKIANSLDFVAVYGDGRNHRENHSDQIGLGFDSKADPNQIGRFTPQLGIAEFRIDSFKSDEALTAPGGFSEILEKTLLEGIDSTSPARPAKKRLIHNIADKVRAFYVDTPWSNRPRTVPQTQVDHRNNKINDEFIKSLREISGSLFKQRVPIREKSITFEHVPIENDPEFLSMEKQARRCNIAPRNLETVITSTRSVPNTTIGLHRSHDLTKPVPARI